MFTPPSPLAHAFSPCSQTPSSSRNFIDVLNDFMTLIEVDSDPSAAGNDFELDAFETETGSLKNFISLDKSCLSVSGDCPAGPISLLFADIAVRTFHMDLWTESTDEQLHDSCVRLFFEALGALKVDGCTVHFAMVKDASKKLEVAQTHGSVNSFTITLKQALESDPKNTLHTFKVLVWLSSDKENKSMARSGSYSGLFSLASKSFLFFGFTLFLLQAYHFFGCAAETVPEWVNFDMCLNLDSKVEALEMFKVGEVTVKMIVGSCAGVMVALFYLAKTLSTVSKSTETRAAKLYEAVMAGAMGDSEGGKRRSAKTKK